MICQQKSVIPEFQRERSEHNAVFMQLTPAHEAQYTTVSMQRLHWHATQTKT